MYREYCKGAECPKKVAKEPVIPLLCVISKDRTFTYDGNLPPEGAETNLNIIDIFLPTIKFVQKCQERSFSFEIKDSDFVLNEENAFFMKENQELLWELSHKFKSPRNHQ